MSELIKLTMDEFEEQFKPIKNPRCQDTILFEIYDDDIEYLKTQKTKNIWTLLDEDEKLYVTNGIRWINRLNYILTDIEWTGDVEVTYN